MKNNRPNNPFLKIFYLLLLSNFLGSAWARIYIGADYGKSTHNSELNEQYKLTSLGDYYGLTVGNSIQFIGLEGFYKVQNPTSKIKHNSTEYKLVEKTQTFGGDLRINFQYLYVKMGYAFHNQKPAIETTTGEAISDVKMNKIYGAGGQSKTSGYTYGLGIQFRFTKDFKVNIGYEYYDAGKPKESYQITSVGIVFRLPEFSPDLVQE